MESVSIIGLGRMGGALAIALSGTEFSVNTLIYHTKKPPAGVLERVRSTALIRFDDLAVVDSDILFVTTPDTELARVAATIAPKVRQGTVVLHTSGALSSEIFRPVVEAGAAAASMHPLVSVSDAVLGSAGFAGAYFCVEGRDSAAAAAKRIVRALGGTAFSIETASKPLYHASAVLASGHLVSLLSAAAKTLSRCGIDESAAKEVLLPLIASSVSNVSRQSFEAALTGPFARVDVDAVERHLAAFDLAELNNEKNIYLELGLASLDLAQAAGGDMAEIERIRLIIKLAQQSARW